LTKDQSYLRNIPKQKRSIDRFNHILDTADKLFAEMGYDTVTTNHIAESAEVAVGSVYHFFGDKDAILQALVHRYKERISEVMPQDYHPPRRIPDVVQEMLGLLLAFQSVQAGLDWMLTQADTVSQAETVYALQNQVIAWVQNMIMAHFPQLPEADAHLCANAGYAIVRGMLTMAHPPNAVDGETLMRETHTALMGYLVRYLARHGIEAGF